MTLHYDIDPKTRFIVLYQDAQMKATRISKLIGIPLRTVYDWIQKVEDDIDILEHQPKNFSQRIDDETRMDITNDTKEAPRWQAPES
jgi:Txe/YoeB family toxin of Txe-Axe toxin-antitoxin module